MTYRKTFDHLGNPVYRKARCKLCLARGVVMLLAVLVAGAILFVRF